VAFMSEPPMFRLLIRIDPQARLLAGDRLRPRALPCCRRVQAERLHFFDPATKQAIRLAKITCIAS